MVQLVAQSDGVSIQPDPQPLRNVFIRSDQYSFIRHGIPALAMDVAPTTPEQEQIYKKLADQPLSCPSDDLDQPVDLEAAGKYEDIIRQLLVKVADDSIGRSGNRIASSGVMRKRRKIRELRSGLLHTARLRW